MTRPRRPPPRQPIWLHYLYYEVGREQMTLNMPLFRNDFLALRRIELSAANGLRR